MIFNLTTLKIFFSKLLVAFCLYILGKVLTHSSTKNLSHYLLQRLKFEPTMASYILKVTNFGIWILLVTAILHEFGVQTASILALLGAASVAIGLALQGTLSNMACGLVLMVLRPFKVGDTIEADSISGVVMAIGVFETEIKTSDGIAMYCPNGMIWGRAIKNLSRYPTRRINLIYTISYESDLEKAKNLVLEYLRRSPLILQDPPVEVVVHSWGDSALNLNVRAWTLKDDHQSLVFLLNEEVKKIFDQAHIKIPYPQMEIYHAKDKS